MWDETKKFLVRTNFTPDAARAFVAETDEVLGALEEFVIDQLKGIEVDADRLAGLASLVRQLKDIRETRLRYRQDLGLIPAVTRAPRESPRTARADAAAAPPPGAQATASLDDVTDDALEAEIAELQRLLAGRRKKKVVALSGGRQCAEPAEAR